MFNFSTITNFMSKTKKIYILKKKNIYSNISDIPQINFDDNDTYLFEKKFNKYIDTFIVFINKNPNIDLNLFYENLKSLIIKERKNFNKFIFIKTNKKGEYNAYTNKIAVINDDHFYNIYHELLHCSSRKLTTNQMNTGFHKFVFDENKDKILFNIGKSLNEGYTSLLEKRYFSEINHLQKTSYIVEQFFAVLLEKIVTKEEMEKLYFNADFDGLVNYLKQFSHEEDIYLFLECLDKTFIKNKQKQKPKDLEFFYKFIACYLLKTYICKLIFLFQSKLITREEFEKLFDDYVEELSINVVFNQNNKYYLLTKNLTDKILDEINEDLEKSKIRLH